MWESLYYPLYIVVKGQVIVSMWKCFVKPVMSKAALSLHTNCVKYSPVSPGKLAWQTVLLIWYFLVVLVMKPLHAR